MQRTWFWAVAALSCLALAACAEDDAPTGTTTTTTLAMANDDGGKVLDPIFFDKGSYLLSPVEGDTVGPCSSSRWVGVVPAGEKCPAAPGSWQLEILYEQSGAQGVPGAVGGYCVYSVQDGALATQEDILDLPATTSGVPAMSWLDADCHAVTPLASCDPPIPASDATDVADYLGQRRVDHFMEQNEPASPYPTRNDSGAGKVYVAMIDTSVNLDGAHGPGTGQSHHGRVLGGIVKTLTCRNQKKCSAEVANHLALTLVSPGVEDMTCGGFFGYHSVLAQAIDEAVDSFEAWQITLKKPDKARLVLNLSVGWEPRYSCDDSAGNGCELTTGARLVRAALRRAVCRGALVIAAAGNRTAGDDGVGLMYPALWMHEPAPTQAMCAQGQYDLDWNPEDPTLYELWQGITKPTWQHPPLVWAVGGVDARDEALQNGRPDGRSIFAAPSFEGMFMDRALRKVTVEPIKIDPTDDGTKADDGTSETKADPDAPTKKKIVATIFTNKGKGKKRASPALTGTSVGAAVTSAAAAGVWHWRPSLAPTDVMWTIYREAEPLGVTANACLSPTCDIRRVSVCRAVEAACSIFGCPLTCDPRPAYTGVTMEWDTSELTDVQGFTSASYLYTPPLTPCTGTPLSDCSTDYNFYGSNCSVPDYCPEETEPNGVLAPWVDPQPGWTPCGACALLIDGADTDVLVSIDARFGGSVINGRLVTTTLSLATETYHFSASVGTLNPGDAVTIRVDGVDPNDLRNASVVFDEVSSGQTYTDPVPISEVLP